MIWFIGYSEDTQVHTWSTSKDTQAHTRASAKFHQLFSSSLCYRVCDVTMEMHDIVLIYRYVRRKSGVWLSLPHLL